MPSSLDAILTLRQADLLGDDIVSSGSQGAVNVQTPVVPQNSQDLLAEIFGSGAPSTSSPAPTPAPAKSSVNDILGLFGSTPSAPSPSPAPSATAAASASLFASTPSPPQPQPTPAASAAPRLQSYTAYDKNELRITLTPQVNAQRPGMVNILVRFQVTGANAASNINFQAAVPKVSRSLMTDFKLFIDDDSR